MSSRSKLLATCGGALTDPNFANVTLLLHGDGSNGAQNNTFLDSSSNNFTITRNGNTTQGSFSPYGSVWSNYFDGSTGYLSVNAQTALSYGTGDFTMEAWVNPASINSGFAPVIEARASASATTYAFGLRVSGGVYKVELYIGAQYTGSTTVNLNAWTHIAVSRSSGMLRIFVNGVLDTSWSGVTTSVDANATDQRIGVLRDGAGYYFPGYISNFRCVKGTAVYTSNFTPPTTPLTAISGTSLLTCQSNRFRDASTNNFAITSNGDVRVTPFSPYAPTAPYSPAANGGSIYFDGSGDFLSYTGSSANALGSGSFTIEFWVNAPLLDDKFFINLRGGMGGAPHITTGGYDGTTVGSLRWVSDSGTITSGSTVVTDNTWHHCAVVKNGTTLTLYVDGVNRGSGTDTSDYSANGGTITIGSNGTGGGNPFQGYLSNLRIVKGTAVYTANFTPPTAPLTAVTNTQLLLNGANAAIFDSAADNDLETVGNAQISTSVKKFGTGSIYVPTGCLFIPNSTELTLGSGDWTVEFFSYNDTSGSRVYFDAWNAAVSQLQMEIYSSGTNLYWVKQGGSVAITANSVLTANTWQHIAACKSGGSTRLFVNGTQVGSTYTDAENYSSSRWEIGRANGQFPINGYIDEFRITKGVARYTANFTPPAAPFPDQ